MKKHLIVWTFAVMSAISCGKTEFERLCSRANGEEVLFGLSNKPSSLQTRSEYSGFIDDYDTERIDWVEGDKISIACEQTENNLFNYTVTSVVKDGIECHAQLTHAPDQVGLCWKDNDDYYFYAVFPSNSNLIPNGNAVFTLPASQTQDASKSGWNSGHTKFKSAVSPEYMQMTAKKKVTKSGEDPSDPVDLSFVMLPTVLEITLQGESDMVVEKVGLESSSTPLTGSYYVYINEKESEANPDFPKTGYQNDAEHVSKSASIVLRDSGEPVKVMAGEELTFTFMLLPKEVKDITFYLTRTVSGKPYTVKTELRYSDSHNGGEFLKFDAHIKYLIKGMVAPDRINWEIDGGDMLVTPLVAVTSTEGNDHFDPIFE